MNKKVLISLAIGGVLLYLYFNNQKKKTAQSANDSATKQKVDSLKAKINSDLPSVLASSPKDATTGRNDNAQAAYDRLKRTLDANLMSIDELQKVADALDARLNKYVGTKNIAQISSESKEVFAKYQIGD
jgi:3-phosphoglycerate kinase